MGGEEGDRGLCNQTNKVSIYNKGSDKTLYYKVFPLSTWQAIFNNYNNMRFLLRSKIHKATVTEANLHYVGSITIDETLIKKIGFWPGEKVLVVSNITGAKLETYIIVGKKNSGIICMNGAAAHLIKAGEEIIIMGFELTNKKIKPKMILVDKKNKFVKSL